MKYTKGWIRRRLQIFLKQIFKMHFHIFKNLPYKLLALFLAVSFWFFLVLFQNIIYDIGEPLKIEVLNNPDDLQIAGPLPEVNVRVTAPKDETAFLRAEDFTAEVDLEDLREGSSTVPIKVRTERKNVNIVSYVPREVVITLEEFEVMSFAVRAEVIGNPARNYMLGERSYRPRMVTVKASKSLVEEIEYIGHTIELNGDETANVKNTYALVVYDTEGNPIDHGIEITPDSVETELKLIREFDEKSVPIVLQFASDVDTTRINESIVSPPTLRIRGVVETISEVGSIKTEPITADDIEAILTDSAFSIKLIVPENVTFIDGEPKVSVEIK